MTDEATLSRAELLASKFAAHRQLARWGKHRASLRPRQREQRTALVRAVRILEDPRFGHGVELRATRRVASPELDQCARAYECSRRHHLPDGPATGRA
jgi:hypothetical protein